MIGRKDRFRGCLIGGAIGDALGWPIEFNTLRQIKEIYGPEGITDLEVTNLGSAEITDDTQMTIFTIEGILRAATRQMRKGIVNVPSVIHRSYLRWLYTQGIDSNVERDGWVLTIKELHGRRGPGNTCLTALQSGKMGTVTEPINNSKGCGGVMRSAPLGLFYKKTEAFQMARDCAAITHGHPSGYLAAGALSYLIAMILENHGIEDAVELTIAELTKQPDHEECSRLLTKARSLAFTNVDVLEAISELGEGWVGEEALAISVYCALKFHNQFAQGVIAAVNHDGDSDSTGAITGNILGCYLGMKGIPKTWVEKVECSKEIIALAEDLFTGYKDDREWFRKYPGW